MSATTLIFYLSLFRIYIFLLFFTISRKDIAITDKNPGEFGVRLSLEGKFVHVEGKTAASLGYSSLELLGKSYFELVHVDDLQKIEDSFGKCKY